MVKRQRDDIRNRGMTQGEAETLKGIIFSQIVMKHKADD